MFRFQDKTVYIVSLERWGLMKISKHHYAMELAHRGCRVYFIEPPDLGRKGVTIRGCQEHPGIRIVNYSPVFRGKRFLPAAVFSALVRLQVRRILRAIGHPPDVVWCFQPYLFEDLRTFGAPLSIFFAADHFDRAGLPPELASADLILAVSETIHRRIRESGYPVQRINHGLQRAFLGPARQRLAEGAPRPLPRRPVVGYSGNMRIETIDRASMLRVIRAHPDFDFVFWGSYRADDMNLFGQRDEATETFLRQLEACPNVRLRGPLDAEVLVREMHEVDLLWICVRVKGLSNRDNSNAHKIIEYLSTGTPVISHAVLSYEGTGLLYMLPLEQGDEFPEFFARMAGEIARGETPELFRKRIEYALDNSYARQVDRIEAMVNGTGA
jgi:glycosyltransferase involved in cell wall biosynthesis